MVKSELLFLSWFQETTVSLGGEGHLSGAHRVWHRDCSQDTAVNWLQVPNDFLRPRCAIPVRRLNSFHPPEVDNIYSMELRKLLSRSGI